MAHRFGFGPVFAAECLTVARRWQVYSGRALLVGGVLFALELCWITRPDVGSNPTIQERAAVGAALVDWLMAVELVLAIAVVPAATAGTICQDKMRGGLTLMMVTDLSDAEIVLGKLAARLVTVFSVIACGLPVLAILTSLGGADPVAIMAGSMVIAGVAVLGVTLSLFFSVWATKPHEAMMATYSAYAIWLLTLLAWTETSRARNAPDIVWGSNPFWLVFGSRWSTGVVPFLASSAFLAGTLALSAALAAISIRRIRPVTLRQAARPARDSARRRGSISRWLQGSGRSERLLDRDPILWREIRRRQPSAWGRAIWTLYAMISSIFVLLAIFVNRNIAAGVSAFMVSIGLLMTSVTAATALAEERAHGSLDVLLTTPLSTRAIVRGKWRGTFRAVKRLAILPVVLAFCLALAPLGPVGACVCAGMAGCLVLAYGAVITSFGQLLAIWQPRLGRAVGFSVAAYLLMTVVYPAVVVVTARPHPNDLVMLCPSPFFGMYTIMAWLSWRNFSVGVGGFVMYCCCAIFLATIARVLLWHAARSFGRRLGRMGPVDREAARGRPARLAQTRPRDPLARRSVRTAAY
jgi:ABC-type transport system involved in multi-copper enzyme maturation permease subunit